VPDQHIPRRDALNPQIGISHEGTRQSDVTSAGPTYPTKGRAESADRHIPRRDAPIRCYAGGSSFSTRGKLWPTCVIHDTLFFGVHLCFYMSSLHFHTHEEPPDPPPPPHTHTHTHTLKPPPFHYTPFTESSASVRSFRNLVPPYATLERREYGKVG